MNEPLIDKERMALLADALGGEKLAELCATARQSIEDTLAELEASRMAGDFATTAKHAHRLVGAAANFAMPALAAAARAVEENCRAGGDGGAGVGQLADIVGRSLAALTGTGASSDAPG